MDQAITTEYIEAMHRRQLVRVPIDQATHFSSGDKYVTAHTSAGDLLLSTTLIHLLSVYGDQLVHIHRSYVVFRHRIAVTTQVKSNTGGTAVLDDGTEIPASRRYFTNVRKIAKRHKRHKPADPYAADGETGLWREARVT